MEETQKLATGDSFVQKVNSQLPPGHLEIKCITDSYFAILGKCEYLNLLKKIELRDLNEQIEFFQQMPLFKTHKFTYQQMKRIVLTESQNKLSSKKKDIEVTQTFNLVKNF